MDLSWLVVFKLLRCFTFVVKGFFHILCKLDLFDRKSYSEQQPQICQFHERQCVAEIRFENQRLRIGLFPLFCSIILHFNLFLKNFYHLIFQSHQLLP